MFPSLLGNEHIQKNLEAALSKGHISHFYLLSGPEGSGKHTLARLLAAAILCSGDRKPCLHCTPCRKVMDGTHPDFITVDDPEKKTVPVDLIRQARADMYIQPNESDHKIYLFPRAQDMGIPGQNALLKVLEEPPKYGVFLLLTTNPEALLPTVRSRCTELRMQALPESLLKARLEEEFPEADSLSIQGAIVRSGGFLGQAKQLLSEGAQVPQETRSFVNAVCKKDALLLTQTLVPMEKWKRDALTEILKDWMGLIESALVTASGIQAVSPMARALASARESRELYTMYETLKKAREYALSNVSPAAVCGYLCWELR